MSTLSQPQISRAWKIQSTVGATLFGHVVRLSDGTPAHRALKLAAEVCTGSRPNTTWRHTRGRPCQSWIQQIGDRTPYSIRAEWSRARDRGHGGSSQRTTTVYVLGWWWWWWWCYRRFQVLLSQRYKVADEFCFIAVVCMYCNKQCNINKISCFTI